MAKKKTRKNRIIDMLFPNKGRAVLLLLGLVAAGVLAFSALHWEYHSIALRVNDARENTLVYSYYSVGDRILKCASDIAILCDDRNNTLWTYNYEMTNPAVVSRGGTFSVYDKNGTGVCVFDDTGLLGAYNTDLPVIAASVSSGGMLAVLLDDGVNTRIDYCDTSGELISTIKTNLQTNGYPMSLSLSDNGNILAVSYLGIENNVQVTTICFYNFSAAGQKETDHIVASYRYENCIVPELRYLNNTECAAFGTDRLFLFGRSDIPLEKKVIELQDIKSTFSDGSYFGVITASEQEGMRSDIHLFDQRGREVMTRSTDFSYTDVSMRDHEIFLSDRNSICVYSVLGDEKFRGTLGEMIREIVPLRNNVFIYTTAESFCIADIR